MSGASDLVTPLRPVLCLTGSVALACSAWIIRSFAHLRCCVPAAVRFEPDSLRASNDPIFLGIIIGVSAVLVNLLIILQVLRGVRLDLSSQALQGRSRFYYAVKAECYMSAIAVLPAALLVLALKTDLPSPILVASFFAPTIYVVIMLVRTRMRQS